MSMFKRHYHLGCGENLSSQWHWHLELQDVIEQINHRRQKLLTGKRIVARRCKRIQNV